MKIKVYIMHSEKINYKEDIYKPLLKEGLMQDYHLILPLAEKYKTTYIKELISESDLVICDLTNFNFFSNIELKVAKKLNKDIFYYINKKDKNVNKHNNATTYTNSKEFAILIKKFLKCLDTKQILLKRDNIYCLGKIQK